MLKWLSVFYSRTKYLREASKRAKRMPNALLSSDDQNEDRQLIASLFQRKNLCGQAIQQRPRPSVFSKKWSLLLSSSPCADRSCTDTKPALARSPVRFQRRWCQRSGCTSSEPTANPSPCIPARPRSDHRVDQASQISRQPLLKAQFVGRQPASVNWPAASSASVPPSCSRAPGKAAELSGRCMPQSRFCWSRCRAQWFSAQRFAWIADTSSFLFHQALSAASSSSHSRENHFVWPT